MKLIVFVASIFCVRLFCQFGMDISSHFVQQIILLENIEKDVDWSSPGVVEPHTIDDGTGSCY